MLFAHLTILPFLLAAAAGAAIWMTRWKPRAEGGKATSESVSLLILSHHTGFGPSA